RDGPPRSAVRRREATAPVSWVEPAEVSRVHPAQVLAQLVRAERARALLLLGLGSRNEVIALVRVLGDLDRRVLEEVVRRIDRSRHPQRDRNRVRWPRVHADDLVASLYDQIRI